MTVVGTVVSDRMHKTISVRQERLVKHPLYGKYLRRSTVYKAHDEHEQARPGDTVEIVHTRPLSKTKHWRLVKIVRRSVADTGRVEDRDDVLAAAGVLKPAGEEAETPPSGGDLPRADEAVPSAVEDAPVEEIEAPEAPEEEPS
jgi:small subunit ribosomal protein S17